MEPKKRYESTLLIHGACASACWADIKKKTFRATERDREDVKKKYADFLAEVSTVSPEKLVFLDEAGVHLAMTRTHARAPQGERVMAKRSAGRASNISLVGAVRLSGMSA